MDSRHELNEDFLILDGLDLDQTYEVRVVAVDGNYNTASDVEEIETSPTGVVNNNKNFHILMFS